MSKHNSNTPKIWLMLSVTSLSTTAAFGHNHSHTTTSSPGSSTTTTSANKLSTLSSTTRPRILQPVLLISLSPRRLVSTSLALLFPCSSPSVGTTLSCLLRMPMQSRLLVLTLLRGHMSVQGLLPQSRAVMNTTLRALQMLHTTMGSTLKSWMFWLIKLGSKGCLVIGQLRSHTSLIASVSRVQLVVVTRELYSTDMN